MEPNEFDRLAYLFKLRTGFTHDEILEGMPEHKKQSFLRSIKVHEPGLFASIGRVGSLVLSIMISMLLVLVIAIGLVQHRIEYKVFKSKMESTLKLDRKLSIE